MVNDGIKLLMALKHADEIIFFLKLKCHKIADIIS